MSVDLAIRTAKEIVSDGSAASTSAKEIARLVFLMRAWSEKSVTLQAATDTETIKNINRWLNEFETMFRTGQLNVNTMSGFGGWSIGRTEAIQAGLLAASADVYDKQLFLDSYRNTIKQLSNKDLTHARLLRVSLTKAWGRGKWKEFYKAFDEFSKESQALGLTLRERTTKFLNQPIAKKFVRIIDRAGRKWSPDRYAQMYARTRGREMEDEIHTDELIANDMDVIKISETATTTPICLQYVGKFFSLTGDTPGFPKLKIRPEFHPNCVHRILAASRVDAAQARKRNISIDKKFKSIDAGLTNAQKKAIAKQEAFILKNRRKIA
jgi:hypothetical protein